MTDVTDPGSRSPKPARVDDWEGEGGAVHPPVDAPSMEGIVVHDTRYFTVGNYRYDRLSDAVAERDRYAGKPPAAYRQLSSQA